MQNKKIEKQEAQIEYLISTIQQLNTNMNTMFKRMLTLITHKPSEKVQDEIEMIPPGNPTNISQSTSTTKHIQNTIKKQNATPLGNWRQQ
jgi:hypothetical protein